MLDEKPEKVENRLMHFVQSPDDFYSMVRESGTLVACFEATWCGDCHYLRPSYPELEARFGPEVRFVSIDIDAQPDIARAHDVDGIPSFILFSNREEAYRFVNPRRKTKEEVADFIEKGKALTLRQKEFG